MNSIETLTIMSLEDAPTSTGKERVTAMTDKGKFSIWDMELVAEIKQKGLPFSYDCKVTEKVSNTGYKMRNIMDAAPLSKVMTQGNGNSFQKESPSFTPRSPGATIDIRTQVALKEAVNLACNGKIEVDAIKDMTLKLYMIMKEISDIEGAKE